MKLLRIIILVLLISATLFTSAFAVNPRVQPVTQQETSAVEPRAEETIWYYRTIDGVKQMRLWSLTYGRWLTDWITLE